MYKTAKFTNYRLTNACRYDIIERNYGVMITFRRHWFAECFLTPKKLYIGGSFHEV